jgi:hypothetical protein
MGNRALESDCSHGSISELPQKMTSANDAISTSARHVRS